MTVTFDRVALNMLFWRNWRLYGVGKPTVG